MRSTAVLRPLQLTCLLTNQQTQTWQNTPTKFPNFLLSRWFCDSIASFAYSRKWMPTKNTLQVNRASLNRPRIATRGLFVSTSRRIFSLKVKVAAARPWRHFFPASPTVGLSSSDSGNSSGSRSGNGEAQCDRNRLRQKNPEFVKKENEKLDRPFLGRLRLSSRFVRSRKNSYFDFFSWVNIGARWHFDTKKISILAFSVPCTTLACHFNKIII